MFVSSIEQKEESRGNDDHVASLRNYREMIEVELNSICDGILKLLDSSLVPSVSDSKVFYLKMKGDYHRYLAEFKIGSERKEAAEATLLARKAAQSSSSNLLAVSDEDGYASIYDMPESPFFQFLPRERRSCDWIAHNNAVFGVCWIKDSRGSHGIVSNGRAAVSLAEERQRFGSVEI